MERLRKASSDIASIGRGDLAVRSDNNSPNSASGTSNDLVATSGPLEVHALYQSLNQTLNFPPPEPEGLNLVLDGKALSPVLIDTGYRPADTDTVRVEAQVEEPRAPRESRWSLFMPPRRGPARPTSAATSSIANESLMEQEAEDPEAMLDDQHRNLVLKELNRPRFRPWTSRELRRKLKSDGHTVKRHFIEKIMKEHLRDGINSLLTEVGRWCTPRRQTVVSSVGVKLTDPPLRTRSRQYSPDYIKSEAVVVSDVWFWVSNLRSLLQVDEPHSQENIVEVVDQLRGIWGALQDIGMPIQCLADVGLKHLQVIDVLILAYGPQVWVLDDLWQCASDCVYELTIADSEYNAQRKQAAKKAANAAGQLISIGTMTPDFYRALRYHYQTVSILHDHEPTILIRQLKHSVTLFGLPLPPNPLLPRNPLVAQEIARAMLSYYQILKNCSRDNDDGMLTLFDRLKSQALTPAGVDSALAQPVLELAELILSQELTPEVRGCALSLLTSVVTALRALQRTRPSRSHPALIRALRLYADNLFHDGHHQEAMGILYEAFGIQCVLSKSRDVHMVRSLNSLVVTYVARQLSLGLWWDALSTTRWLLDILVSAHNLDVSLGLSHCIGYFRDFSKRTWQPQALHAIRGLTDTFRRNTNAQYSGDALCLLTRALIDVSDLQRELGEFRAALDTSREALSSARELSASHDLLVYALACHAVCLADNDDYHQGTVLLREAISVCDQFPEEAWVKLLGLFGIVHAHLSRITGAPSSFHEEVAEYPRRSPSSRTVPCWLSFPKNFHELDGDVLSWHIFIQILVRHSMLSGQVSASAEHSLVLLSEYCEASRERMDPHAQVSVLGQKHILYSIIGKREEAQAALDTLVSVYRSVLTTKPLSARLPLLHSLEILLVLSPQNEIWSSAASNLRKWKKDVYAGSLEFFDDFIGFLRDLPRYIHSGSLPSTAGNQEIAYTENTGMATGSNVGSSSRQPRIFLDHPSGAHRNLTQRQVQQADVSIDLRGKTIHFDHQVDPVASSNINKSSKHTKKVNIEAVPNLSRHIKIIKRPLRAGGFCDVYSGELTREGAPGKVEVVAMKMLRLFNTEKEEHLVKAKRKFRHEVSLWCSLRHLYVLPFYGTCELDESRLFMVSPWAAGGNSLQYLEQNPSADRTKFLWQTSSALEYLLSGRDTSQVIHGDLKADNVLVSATGDALLCDFGLSRYVEEIISKSGSSSAGRGGGHARFTAPELLLPPKDAPRCSRPTPESDVFAFGSLMLQIYTEELPFGDHTLEAEAILNIVRGEHPPRPTDSIVLDRGCDDRVWSVMTQCWKFEPSARPTIGDVMERLAVFGPYAI